MAEFDKILIATGSRPIPGETVVGWRESLSPAGQQPARRKDSDEMNWADRERMRELRQAAMMADDPQIRALLRAELQKIDEDRFVVGGIDVRELLTDAPTTSASVQSRPTEPAGTINESAAKPKTTTKPLRSTEPGEGRAKLIAAEVGNDAAAQLLSVFTDGLSDERLANAAGVRADRTLGTDEKLWAIDRLLKIPPTASAERLGKLLGVTGAMVKKTTWWIQNRKGKKAEAAGQREAKLRQRGKDWQATANDKN